MPRRAINVLLGGAIASVVVIGLLLQGWAVLGSEETRRLNEARVTTLLAEQKSLKTLLQSERNEKIQLLRKYDAASVNFSAERQTWSSEKEVLESQLSKEREQVANERDTCTADRTAWEAERKENALAFDALQRDSSSVIEACAAARDVLESQLSRERQAGKDDLELLEVERIDKAQVLQGFEALQRNFTFQLQDCSSARELLEYTLSRERVAWSRSKDISDAENQKKADDALSECVRLEAELHNLSQGWTKTEAADKCRQHCAIIDFSIGFDMRFAQKADELQQKIAGIYPTFEELYGLVLNRPYNAEDNVWHHFPNPYNMTTSFAFPFSNLLENDLLRVFEKLGRPPLFMVEVGSFHGHSAVKTAKLLDKLGLDHTPLLCVDPWAGDLGELLYRDDWESKIVPGEITDGRSTSYFQFMLNIKSQIELGEIGHRHVIPLAVTSLVGARYLTALKLRPDIVYLDSAHEMDETFTEVSLYYNLLADGGILFGDDFLWYSVSTDVKRFAERYGLELTLFGNCWMLEKPAGSAIPKFNVPEIFSASDVAAAAAEEAQKEAEAEAAAKQAALQAEAAKAAEVKEATKAILERAHQRDLEEKAAKKESAARRVVLEAENAAGCDLMVLTTFCTTKRDWQRNVSAPPEFWLMEDFYKSAHERRINVTVLYDELPWEILRHRTESFKFERVDLTQYDPDQGLNDVRFDMIRDLVDRNPDWRSLFLVDLFDVKIGLNPCGQIADKKLYVGKERDRLSHNAWMDKRFQQMGGKYLSWFHDDVRRLWFLMNAGVIGGRRDVFVEFLKEMTGVLNDPELEAKKVHQQENVNMAALNYVVRVSMNLTENSEDGVPGFVHGTPVHSEYKRYESDRSDVWFIHK